MHSVPRQPLDVITPPALAELRAVLLVPIWPDNVARGRTRTAGFAGRSEPAVGCRRLRNGGLSSRSEPAAGFCRAAALEELRAEPFVPSQLLNPVIPFGARGTTRAAPQPFVPSQSSIVQRRSRMLWAAPFCSEPAVGCCRAAGARGTAGCALCSESAVGCRRAAALKNFRLLPVVPSRLPGLALEGLRAIACRSARPFAPFWGVPFICAF